MTKLRKTGRRINGKNGNGHEDSDQRHVPSKAFLAALDAVSRMKERTTKKR